MYYGGSMGQAAGEQAVDAHLSRSGSGLRSEYPYTLQKVSA